MNSVELAQEISILVNRCTGRVRGIGDVQYSIQHPLGDVQTFETDSFPELKEGILEEIEDAVNHLCMLHIRVRRIGEEANRLNEGS
jgi:hypothetical protein